MLRQVVRELRFHPSRFIATVLAVAISVAFMAGSSILVATESNGMQRVQSLPISTADVVVSVGPDAGSAEGALSRVTGATRGNSRSAGPCGGAAPGPVRSPTMGWGPVGRSSSAGGAQAAAAGYPPG